MERVTVIMSALNDSSTVADAVESIRGQSYKEWRLIAVDDGSTDATGRILDEFATQDERIEVIHHAANAGLGSSLNEALSLARGELIARMDGDDISHPERFSRQVSFLAANPEIHVVGTAAELMDSGGQSVGVFTPECEHDSIVGSMFRKTPFVHPSVMARREFFSMLGGYDERLKRGQDFDLWVRGGRHFRYANLPEALIRYRIRRRPSLLTILYASYVTLRAARREGKLLTHGWLALRCLMVGLWARTIR